MYKIIVTTTFGIEAITGKELKNLGYEDLQIENGKITFEGDEMDVAICNIHLRTAERVFLEMAEFEATSFEELFQGTKKVDWASLIPIDGKMHIIGKSVKSTLHSVPDCQGIVKKAVVEKMKEKYNTDWFSEDGPVYKIEVGILKDKVTLAVDTSGVGLHKRGYRENAGMAPLKETLAAALVLIAKFNGDELLIDPFCGSGTIPIEAALIAKNIAPGVNRHFVSETWPTFDKEIWDQVREGAKRSVNKKEFVIQGSDIDGRVLRTAMDNAKKAGVEKYVNFQRLDMKDVRNRKKGGMIITNPPYGERLLDEDEVKSLYKTFSNVYAGLEDWSCYVLTSYDDFQKVFGKKADKNRKLYNGRLQCYYYQYNPKK
ncbi:class I SAM-dependent RNA methyltransferase [uncultured Clostridium sp.]|uniref:THUMP domain-containing class I SAM-dependent RNA methyltransferase n=1 Tax=uncultured Clostridium sp. TaxID=59620 RepID=UPI003217CD07